MKFTNCCLLALAITCFYYQIVQAAVTAEEKARDDCFKEHKLTAEEIERVNSDKMIAHGSKTAPKSLQCFLHCFYQKLGMISADNSYKYDLIAASIGEELKVDEKRVAALMAKCKPASTTGANECERTFNFEICLHDM